MGVAMAKRPSELKTTEPVPGGSECLGDFDAAPPRMIALARCLQAALDDRARAQAARVSLAKKGA